MPTPPPDTSRRPDTPWRADVPPALARRKRPLVPVVTGIALAAAAGFAARGMWPGTPSSGAATRDVPVATATVIRTDVSAREVVAGTLGYRGTFTVVNEFGDGIVTWLPGTGSIVRRDQALFRLDGRPATLLYGPVPAWRDFGPGMTPGPDVRELQRNLAVLGFAPGAADGQFGSSTEAAIERWQQAHGLTVTGTIPLGEVAFLPGPLRVTATPAALGSPVGAGTAILSGTSDTPAVSVSLTVGGPAVQPGDPVVVTMPDGTTAVPGVVASVGQVATIPNAAASNAGGQGSGTPSAAIPVTIRIGTSRIPPGLDQAPVQVAITQQRDHGVLAVPVTALLALPGGGYAVRLSGSGHRLIPVTTGLFDDADGLVEVTGQGLAAGQAVEVAQG